MREVVVRIEFMTPCLGNLKKVMKSNRGGDWTVYYLPRTPDGQVRLEQAWWSGKLSFAAEVLCRHQRDIKYVTFEVAVDGKANDKINKFYERYITGKRYVRHECFAPGEVIGVNCVVPSSIPNDDFWRIMENVGKFRGISPFGKREDGFGHFKVVSVMDKKREDAKA